MAISPARVSATTTATKLAENTTADTTAGDYIARSYAFKNMTKTDTIYLGGASTVTSANGFAWDPTDGPISVDLEPGEQLWGIVPTTTQLVHVLSQGR